MPRARILLLAAALFCGACMKGPKYSKPAAPVPTAYKETPPAGWKEAQPSDELIRGKWWELYNDPALNALEEQVEISNQNVLAAEAQYRVAKAAVRAARSALFPLVTGSASATFSEASSRGLSAAGRGGSSGVNQNYILPIDVSWQPDVWGSIRRSVNSNVALAQAAGAQMENVKLLFQSELALDYFQLHGLDGERDLLERTVKDYREYLDLVRRRFEGGIATDADVIRSASPSATKPATRSPATPRRSRTPNVNRRLISVLPTAVMKSATAFATCACALVRSSRYRIA